MNIGKYLTRSVTKIIYERYKYYMETYNMSGVEFDDVSTNRLMATIKRMYK